MIFCWSILVFAPEPVLPDEIDEQAPQHQVEDDERDGEPQGRIENIIDDVHNVEGLFFPVQSYAGPSPKSVLIRNRLS